MRNYAITNDLSAGGYTIIPSAMGKCTIVWL